MGVVRGATFKMVEKGRTKFLNRSVQRLYPFEIQSDKPEVDGDIETQSCENSDRPHRPARRAAAFIDSIWKTQAMLEP
jgi:hypothetical protein